MILVRFRNGHEPKAVFYGYEGDIVNELKELDLNYNRDSHFYEKNNSNVVDGVYDYYIVCEDGEDMEKHIKDYNINVLKN